MSKHLDQFQDIIYDEQSDYEIQKKRQDFTGGSIISQISHASKKKVKDIQWKNIFTSDNYQKDLFFEQEDDQEESQFSVIADNFEPENKIQLIQDHSFEQEDMLPYKQSDENQQFTNKKMEQEGKTESHQVLYDDNSIFFKKMKNQMLVKKNPKQLIQRNKNGPKFVCRVFIKYLVEYKAYYNDYPDIFSLVYERSKKLDKWTKQSKNNAFTIHHMLQLINGVNSDKTQSFINRKVLKLILRDQMQEEVIINGQVKKKKTYMNMIKVFSIRCFNSSLIYRLQSK